MVIAKKAVEMSTRTRFSGIGTGRRWTLALACVAALTLSATLAREAAAQAADHRTFATPEDAVKTLVDTVKKGDVDALLAIFGPEGKDLLASSEPATARLHRQVFSVAAAERWRLTDDSATRKTLVIGNEDWPFPVPLVKEGNVWRFDTAAGKEEVIARRIGENELATIDSVKAYVSAQKRYAAEGHDGNQAGIFATKFQSDTGKENGLYWPTVRGQKRSPLGDLVAQAAEEGRPVATSGGAPPPFHGYYFKILTAQGAAAPGGAKQYIVKGQMTGGFALIAWPAQYDVTGVMTFIVNQDGTIHEKDLGPETATAAKAITAYNPDASWRTEP